MYLFRSIGPDPGARALASEFLGTLILVVLAAGSVVADARHGGALGPAFAAVLPAVGVAAGVYMFGRASGAHFNPAVTLGLLVLGKVGPRRALLYVLAQSAGALLASLFVSVFVGAEASLGANVPGLHPLPGLLLAEAAVAMALMLAVIASLRMPRLGGAVIGAAVGLGVFFAGEYSGASMNPARSLGPALVSGSVEHLWMYVAMPAAGALASAFASRWGKVNSLMHGRRAR